MCARVVVNMQLVVVFEAAEVGEAGGVVKQNTQREPSGARIACEVGVAVEIAELPSEVLPDGLSRSRVPRRTRRMTTVAKADLVRDAAVITESGVSGRPFSVSRRP